ncbi:hypothetical protein [Brevibacterium oceani]|nr:hypothetical protein [Brevibacterium oceani]
MADLLGGSWNQRLGRAVLGPFTAVVVERLDGHSAVSGCATILAAG